MPSNNVILSRYLDTNGDGSGDKNAIGDYSSQAESFFISPSTYPLIITRMIVSAEDTGGMTAQEYGNLNLALTNGVVVRYEFASGSVDLTDGNPVKTNAEWGSLCYDSNILNWGAGNDLLVVRWTFSKSGTPISLDVGERLSVQLNDNFSGLISHKFLVQGFEVR